MTTKKWFVFEGEDEVGPIGPNGLRKWVREGRILKDTLIRRDDQVFLVRADEVRGLFDEPPPARRQEPRPMMHGPYASLRALGWGTAAAMAVWVLVAMYGVFAAIEQHGMAERIAAGELANTPLLGFGGVVFTVLFLATGVLFVYWLWNARVNVPHLIHARMHLAPSWTIGAWFVPPLNLWRPFEVLDEIDRLSAEAAADGDARVPAQRGLLVPWWLCTVAIVAVGVRYEFMAQDSTEAIAEAALWHVTLASLVVVAALLATAVVLRITFLQERAHAAHQAPVELHRPHLHRAALAHS
ncbi:MAG: DUF4328 domain-containing protein [Planctomycetes bacterium]|nr:DUF4328 domain-containing protein [Planctomycetota bacterium]